VLLNHVNSVDYVLRRSLHLPIAGFTSIRTLRSASSASIISPASIKDGLTSAYFHDAGTAAGLG
jgi:hypothetical protein